MSTESQPIRIVVVDDDQMVVTGLTTMLQVDPELRVVGTANSGEAAIEVVAQHFPDVVLMDLGMPGIGGVEAIRRLVNGLHPPVVVALTSFDSNNHIFRAIEAGAAGYLLKDTSPPDLVTAVKRAAAGESVLSPRVIQQLMAQVSDNPHAATQREAAELVAALTAKELEVARLVAEGLSNAEIAARLFLSESTVKTHVNRAMLKLDAPNRVNLAVIMERARLYER